jgi:GTP-binding protein Era
LALKNYLKKGQKMTDTHRFGVIALVGRPNVGKSSLLNQLVRAKVSIISRRPQTTWRRIEAIRSVEDAQLVIVDTPGLHKARGRLLNRIVTQSARGAAEGAHVVCQVIDARVWSQADQSVLDHFSRPSVPLWVVLNKVDLLPNVNHVLPRMKALQEIHPWVEIVPVSAKSGYNCERLFELLQVAAPCGSPGYPSSELTTASSSFVAAELVREQIFRQMGDEIPYGSGVELTLFETDENQLLHIEIIIWCETVGQKAALIGVGGERLKKIGSAARRQIENVLNCRVHLAQRVKVKRGWVDDRKSVVDLGYGV